jgi:hypothetical protein
MQSTSAKAACEQLPKQKTYAHPKNSKHLFFVSIEKVSEICRLFVLARILFATDDAIP